MAYHFRKIREIKKNAWQFQKAQETFENQKGLCADCGKQINFEDGLFLQNGVHTENGLEFDFSIICEDCERKQDNSLKTKLENPEEKEFIENAKGILKAQENKCWYCQRNLELEKAYYVKPFGFSSKEKIQLVCSLCNFHALNHDYSRDYILVKMYKNERLNFKSRVLNRFIEAYAFTILKAQKEFTWQLKKNNLPYDEDDLMDFQLLVREKYFKQAIEYCARHLDEHEKNKKVYTIEFALFPNAKSRGGYFRNLIKHLIDKKFNEVFPDKKRKKKGEKTTASERRKSVLSIDGFENFDLSDSRTLTPEQIYERKETWEHFQKALDNFRNCLRDDTERMIFDYYRNLNEKPKSERKIGEELGIERNKFNRTTKKMKLFVKDFERNYIA